MSERTPGIMSPSNRSKVNPSPKLDKSEGSLILLSICIPCYNRPTSLAKLLASVDCDPESIEIVVAEDGSPRRAEIREVANLFQESSVYKFKYLENPENLGFDGNVRGLVRAANGQYVMFIGDDDEFLPGALDEFLEYLSENTQAKYILRSYSVEHDTGRIEVFRYRKSSMVLEPGQAMVTWLFKRSVTISGFTIDRACALEYETNELDGTLLYQVYLMAATCLNSPSAYCNTPVALVSQTYREDAPMFGSAKTESGKYTPGRVTEDNSINFTKSYFEVTEFLDKQFGVKLTELVRLELSKYSYPFLSIQRKRGLRPFLAYSNRLARETGLDASPMFHVYKWGLALGGERFCDTAIARVKGLVGHAPNI